MHAALGEPARLAIADRLVLGDASPTETERELSLPSNLLAHHLKLLEQAGVIERSRSEGDQRRTYLRLRPLARRAGAGRGGAYIGAAYWFTSFTNPAITVGRMFMDSFAGYRPRLGAGLHRCPGDRRRARDPARPRALSRCHAEPGGGDRPAYGRDVRPLAGLD